MQAMQIFERCRNAPADIRRLEDRIQRRRDMVNGMTGHVDPNLGSRAHSGEDRMASMAADLEQLQEDLRGRRERQLAEAAAVCALIDTLPELDAKVLYAYYVDGVSVAAFARANGYSAGYIRNVKHRAMQQLRGASLEGLLPEWYG